MEFAILLVLVLIGGWFLGVIGFFKVLSARGEIERLRRAVDALAVVREAQPAEPHMQAHA